MMNENGTGALNNCAVSAKSSASATGGDIFNQEDDNITITSSTLAIATFGRFIAKKTRSQ
jgi:hypothetical protein